jgi:hypothetical protein
MIKLTGKIKHARFKLLASNRLTQNKMQQESVKLQHCSEPTIHRSILLLLHGWDAWWKTKVDCLRIIFLLAERERKTSQVQQVNKATLLSWCITDTTIWPKEHPISLDLTLQLLHGECTCLGFPLPPAIYLKQSPTIIHKNVETAWICLINNE